MVTRDRARTGKPKSSVHINPLVLNWEMGDLETGFLLDAEIFSDSEVIGVIPSPPGSVAVIGFYPDPNSKHPGSTRNSVLGFEIPGQSPTDWAVRYKEIEEEEKEVLL